MPRTDTTSNKGDLQVDDGQGPRRLAVGADDEVVTADSTAGVGLKYAAGGGGGGAPTSAEYVTKSTNATLSAERVLTDISRSGIKEDWATDAGQLRLSATSMIFITDITCAGTMSGKTWETGTSPTSKVLTAATSDTDNINVYIEVDAGSLGAVGQGWQPVVTIHGGYAPVVAVLTAVTGHRRFTGVATIVGAISDTLYAESDDGGKSQNVAYTRESPPTVSGEWNGTYPTGTLGLQSAVKTGDVLTVTGTVSTNATTIRFVGGVSAKETGANQDVTGTWTTGTFSVTNVSVSGNTGVGKYFQLQAKASGGYGDTYNGTQTFEIDNVAHVYSSTNVGYPGTHFAIQSGAGTSQATMTVAITNWSTNDSISYSSTELTVPATNAYASNKTVSYLSGSYRDRYSDPEYNITITSRRLANDKTNSQTMLVSIANVAPLISIAGASGTNRLISGTGTTGATYGLTYTANQELVSAPSLLRSASDTATNPVATLTIIGTDKRRWTTSIRVCDVDPKNTGSTYYVWRTTAYNGAGIVQTNISTNPNYTIGGFQQRDLSAAQYVHTLAIGTQVSGFANTTKLTNEFVGLGTGLYQTQVVTNAGNRHYTITSDSAGTQFSSTGTYMRSLDPNVYNNVSMIYRIKENA